MSVIQKSRLGFSFRLCRICFSLIMMEIVRTGDCAHSNFSFGPNRFLLLLRRKYINE